MPIQHMIWSIDDRRELRAARLASEDELESLLNENIALLNPEWMVIGRQVRMQSGGALDLLCLDHSSNALIVLELKRDRTPRDVTMQAIDYASCMAEKSFEEILEIYAKYAEARNGNLMDDYKARYGTDLDEESFDGSQVEIVIIASQMDATTERIVRYLKTNYDVPIDILFFSVHEHLGQRLISRSWFLQDTEKPAKHTKAKGWNGEYYVTFGDDGTSRSWEDAAAYGFVSAGGDPRYSQPLGKLSEGDHIWVMIPKAGYVGTGIVTGPRTMARDALFTIDEQEVPFPALPLRGTYTLSGDADTDEYLVPVQWTHSVSRAKAVWEKAFFSNQTVVAKPNRRWAYTLEQLKRKWGLG